MGKLDFDGRVAVITGAGGNPGLGRGAARLMASRGAKLLINDVAESDAPTGPSAQRVADEIYADGGEAVADNHSVADPDGAKAIVEAALNAFGRIDILINNAAVCVPASIEEMTPADFRAHIDVNLLGAVWMTQAAWPHMRKQSYGRIVNMASDSMSGFAMQAAYSASKAGLWSLTRTTAAEGKDIGIKANAVCPGGYSNLMLSMLEPDSPLLLGAREQIPPELSAPAIAYLAHESCPTTGDCIGSVAGNAKRIFMGETTGIIDREISIETIAERWDEITDAQGATIIEPADRDTSDWKMKAYQPSEGPNV